MKSPNCQFNIIGNVNYCPNCGSPMSAPVFNMPNPQMRISDEERKKLTFASVKSFFSSPIYIVFILLSAINAVVSICVVAFSKNGFNTVIDKVDFESSGVALGAGFSFFADSMPYVYIVSVLIIIIMTVLRYLIYRSACRKDTTTVNYKAINALKWSHWFSFVFDTLYVALVLISFVATEARVDTTELEFRFLIGLLLVIVAIAYALPTLYTVFITRALKNVRNTAKNGVPNSKISVFLIVVLFVISGFSMSSLLSELVAGEFEWSFLVSQAVSIAINVVMAFVVIKYRTLMKSLENIR